MGVASARSMVTNLGRGAIMGIADVVPGVSGGTMALLLGIYDRFIAALARLEPRLLWLLPGIVTVPGRNRFVAHAARTDLWFLVQLGIGIGAALIAGAHIVGNLIEDQPAAMMALFFGLILASVRIPWRTIMEPRRILLIPAAIGVAAAVVVASLPGQNTDPSLWFLVVAGVLAISAMLLPGISGSAVLVVIGAYPVVLDAVRSWQWARIVVFALGAIIGLLVASRAIRAALKRWSDVTHALLTGLMLGSLVRVWPWRSEMAFGEGAMAVPDTVMPALFIVLGAALSLGLERMAQRPAAETG